MDILGTNSNDILIGTTSADRMTGQGGDDWIRGREGDDTITGDAGADALFGGPGRDSLQGGAGNDALSGDEGDDTLDGGSGASDIAAYATASSGVAADLAAGTATGGAGNDTLTGIENLLGSDYNDTLSGDAGANLLAGNGGADVLHGAGGDDTLVGGAGRDSLDGGAGDDTLTGGAGNDTLDGGAQVSGDTVSYAGARGPVLVDLAAGTARDGSDTDTLVNIENIRAGRFGDGLKGNSSANVFLPGAGDDTVDGAAGIDRVSYEDAAGAVTINLQAGTTSGAAGSDTLTGIEQAQGSGHDDVLIGSSVSDTLIGGAGQDTLHGGLGDDSLDGGANISDFGPDWVSYLFASGAVNVNLATGAATGSQGNDTLSNVEAVMGTSFADTLTGDGQDNVLRGNGGDDVIDGGGGSGDWVDYAAANGAVAVSLVTGTSTGADGHDLFQNIECVAGSSFADLLTGDAGDNRLQGNGGDDTLVGGAGTDGVDYHDASGPVTVRLALGVAAGADGNDSLVGIEDIHGSLSFGDDLRGDAGPNVIEGRGGNDVIDGAGGIDIAVFNGRFAQYRVLVEVGNFDLIVAGPEGVDRLNNVEVLQFADRVFVVHQGGETADHLAATVPGELLRGRGGNDDVTGSSGEDALYGDDGADTLDGGTGNDFLDGGTGSDTMNGGAGDDVYVVDSSGDIVAESDLLAVGNVDGPTTLVSIGQSIDTVIASINYTLGSFLENLTLASGGGGLAGSGNELDNVLDGNEGDNALYGGAGNDTLTGEGGIDTATYDGPWGDYLLTAEEADFKLQGPAEEGTDTLDVERLQFDDILVALDLDGNAGTVAKILGAVFGVASVANMQYVGIGLDAADAGMGYEDLVALALNARLGAGASNADVVTLLYTNVIGVAPDAATLASYKGLLDNGSMTQAGLGMLAAETSFNQDNIDLTGLAETGLAYL